MNPNETLEQASGSVASLREQAAPVLDRVTAQAQALAKRSAQAVRETSQQLRNNAARVSDTTVGYVKDEPIKAILIAAAAGAALMALVTLLARSRGRD